MLSITRFETLIPGPHLTIFGAVHGNETCGTQAIRRLIDLLNNGFALSRGTLTCVPICNPKAFENGTRFYQRNLNRSLYIKESPRDYEDLIDPVLCGLLDQSDVLLDLHSYASQGGAFGFLGNTSAQEIDYCRSLGVNNFVYGWADAFGKVEADPRDNMGTVEYARSVGCMATTIECGHHHNKGAADIAYRTIVHALAHFDMIAPDSIEQVEIQPANRQRFVQMRSVFHKQKEGDTTHPWKHYDSVAKNDILATYADGEKIIAPEDGVIILPKLQADVGGEWFYFGVETPCPAPMKH